MTGQPEQTGGYDPQLAAAFAIFTAARAVDAGEPPEDFEDALGALVVEHWGPTRQNAFEALGQITGHAVALMGVIGQLGAVDVDDVISRIAQGNAAEPR